jgi:hypothetical protein
MADLSFFIDATAKGSGKDSEGVISVDGQSVRFSAPASMGGKGAGASPETLLISAVMIADALTVRGLTVVHIMGTGKTMAHALTPWAVVDGLRVTYPSAVPAAQRPSVEGPAQRPRMPG